jgi:hypothetical protein
MKNELLARFGACAILSLGFLACQKDQSATDGALTEPVSSAYKSKNNDPEGITFYALDGNTLDKFSTSDPEKVISSATITGLQAGETILGIDFRPLTGGLYALGSRSRLYMVNPTTGMATLVAPLTTATGALMLSGNSFAFDFNPTVDRIRIVSNTGQNLRVNPINGVTLVDGGINPMPASVNAAAYSNNDNDPATATKLFVIDPASNLLYEVNPPNAGTLTDPIQLKLKVEGDGGFDIAPRNANVTTDIGLALYEVNKKSTLFRIDLETGETQILAKYKKNVMYSAIAISPAL